MFEQLEVFCGNCFDIQHICFFPVMCVLCIYNLVAFVPNCYIIVVIIVIIGGVGG